jgi:hypothetical protein
MWNTTGTPTPTTTARSASSHGLDERPAPAWPGSAGSRGCGAGRDLRPGEAQGGLRTGRAPSTSSGKVCEPAIRRPSQPAWPKCSMSAADPCGSWLPGRPRSGCGWCCHRSTWFRSPSRRSPRWATPRCASSQDREVWVAPTARRVHRPPGRGSRGAPQRRRQDRRPAADRSARRLELRGPHRLITMGGGATRAGHSAWVSCWSSDTGSSTCAEGSS